MSQEPQNVQTRQGDTAGNIYRRQDKKKKRSPGKTALIIIIWIVVILVVIFLTLFLASKIGQFESIGAMLIWIRGQF